MKSDELADAMSRAARSLHSPQSLEETLGVIARTAQLALPGFDAVGISTVDSAGNVETRAGTDALVWELDGLQYQLGEGPCLDTLRDAEVVSAPAIRHDQRWPRFTARAVEMGLRSQLAVKLYLDAEGTLGGLNMYSTSSEDIDPDALPMAQLFAAHAAVALGNATELAGLSEAIRSRTTIGQATGMLMEKYTLDADTAFGLLVRMSSQSNIKVRDIARTLVEEAAERAAAARTQGS